MGGIEFSREILSAPIRKFRCTQVDWGGRMYHVSTAFSHLHSPVIYFSPH